MGRHAPRTTGLTPLQRYRRDLEQGEFTADPAQEEVVRRTECLYQQLSQGAAPGPLWRRLLPWRDRPAPVKGLYLWGGVGRGKTWLVDCFHDCLPGKWGMRLHFHRFMQTVHDELRRLRQVRDPLRTVAGRLCKGVRVLCLDEFHVADITDAMLLAGLLQSLSARGVSLVSTSNEAPDDLYRDGLQRQRFLPAIALLKAHTHVVRLDSDTDYRLRYLDRAEIYHVLRDGECWDAPLLEYFSHIAAHEGRVGGTLDVLRRYIPIVRAAEGVIWFEFSALCDGPRGVADYIELARCYHTVLLERVPVMAEEDDEQAKRFITLIDEFYDRRVKLIITAAAAPGALYRGRRLAREFRRTNSRLQEMRSREYLSSPHLS